MPQLEASLRAVLTGIPRTGRGNAHLFRMTRYWLVARPLTGGIVASNTVRRVCAVHLKKGLEESDGHAAENAESIYDAGGSVIVEGVRETGRVIRLRMRDSSILAFPTTFPFTTITHVRRLSSLKCANASERRSL